MSDPAPGAYVGRFAPSPTGPLHFGSLIAAVASYLDARSNRGLWLVRMEDLDPPRNSPEAAKQILDALERFGLTWDHSVLYQSTRLDSYEQALVELRNLDQVYACTCPRTRGGGIYSGQCRDGQIDPETDQPHALRLRVTGTVTQFEDLIQGVQRSRLDLDAGDFVVKRKDGLHAYQLAVVVDDAYQGITRIVRGSDLLPSTCRQIYLQQLLGHPHPGYAHIPVIVNEIGNKLSKQTFAPALDGNRAQTFLTASFSALGLNPPTDLTTGGVDEILEWGTAHWNLNQCPRLMSIPEHGIPGL